MSELIAMEGVEWIQDRGKAHIVGQEHMIFANIL